MKNLFLLLILILSVLFISCENEKEDPELPDDLVINTNYTEVDSVFKSTVLFGGEIKTLPVNVTNHGFVYGINTAPVIEEDSIISLGVPDFEGDFFEIKKGFEPGVSYYARAFVATGNKVYYGSTLSFSMSLIKNIEPVGAGRLDTITIYGINFLEDSTKNIIKFNNSEFKIISFSQNQYGSEIKAVVAEETSLGEKTVTVNVNETKSEYGKPFIVDPYIKIPGIDGNKQEIMLSFSIDSLFYILTENTNELYVFNEISQTWTKLSDFPGSKREGSTVFTFNNKAYMGLGYLKQTYFKDFYEYNPETNTWTKINDFPGTGRFNAQTFTLNNKGYVLIGRSFIGDTLFFKDMYSYDPENDIWERLNDIPFNPWNYSSGSTFIINNKAYLLIDLVSGVFFRSYDQANDHWDGKSYPNSIASGDLSIVINNECYKFFTMRNYKKYDSNTWEEYFYKHREIWVKKGASNGKIGVIAENTQNMWIFNPN